MALRSSVIFKASAIVSGLALSLHVLLLWASPFKSIYPTAPSILLVALFLAVFLLSAKVVIAWPVGSTSAIPDWPGQLDMVFEDRRLRIFLMIASLAGISMHIWSKYYLTGIMPIHCISEIRFAWLEVDRNLLPINVRLGSILGHLLTSFAYLGLLTTSYTCFRSRSKKAVAFGNILSQVYFSLIGVLYAGFIGSRNAMLAFFLMSLVGVLIGLSSSTAGEPLLSRLISAVVVLSIPMISMLAFSSAIFSDRLFCNKTNSFNQLQGRALSLRQGVASPSETRIVKEHLGGSYREFALNIRHADNNAEWRERLFIDTCRICGPTMIYANHGIFNFSNVLAGQARGDRVLLKFVSAWGKRFGLDINLGSMYGVRVYGPGGVTLAGAAFHDYGPGGLVLTSAVLGLGFGNSIRMMQSTGVRMLIGIWLFSCLFYVLLLSNIFVGLSLLPFPFIAFGIGVGLTVWLLMNRKPANR